MRGPAFAFGILFVPFLLAAQQRPPADTLHQHGDSLTRRPLELSPVTVTAAPARRESPTTEVSVSGAVLQRTPARDAYELLRQAAGLEVHEQGQGPGFASNASLRGFSSDHSTDLALWIDGVPNNEPANGHAEGYNDWSLLFPEATLAIDVIKGPTSALYGNFALAGAISVRTLERMHGTSAWGGGGSYGRFDGGLLTGFDRGRDGGVFGIRGEREDGWRPHSGYRLGQAHSRVVRDLAPLTRVDAAVDLYAAGWDSPGYLTQAEFDGRQYGVVTNPSDGGFKRHAQERVSLRTFLGSSLLWRSTAYATQGRWQLFLTIPAAGGQGEGTGSQTEEEDRRYGFGVTSALTWALPRAEVTLGAEGRWDHASYENWFTTSRGRDSAQTLVAARQISGAVFVLLNQDLGHHVRVNVGGRYDALSTRSTAPGASAVSAGHGVFSPKLGVLLHVPRWVDLYGNVSRGFRQTDGVVSDPALPYITAWAFEAGVKVDARGVNATAALFRADVSNEQTFNPVTLASTSGGASRRQGLELEAHAVLSAALSAGTSWTFNDARYRRLVTEDADTLSGARVFNTAKYVGTLAVELAPPAARWHLRAGANVVGPYSPFDEPGVVLPAFALLHLSEGVRLGSVQLELGVRNLLDRAYPELRAGGLIAPGQPRTAHLSARYVF